MILILCPLKVEMTTLLQMFEKDLFTFETQKISDIPVYVSKDKSFVLALGGLGKVEMALHTQHLIQSFKNTQLVICAGIAGQLTDTITIGDTVVATHTIEHDFKQSLSPLSRPQFKGSAWWIEQLQSHHSSAHFGIVASGDEDINDLHRKQDLAKNTQALAVAWEGAGAARAARFFKKDFLEIRGISDTAENIDIHTLKTNLPISLRGTYQTLKLVIELSLLNSTKRPQ